MSSKPVMKTAIQVCKNGDGVIDQLINTLSYVLQETSQNERIVIGLSGGSLPKFFAGAVKKMLQNDEHSKSWERVKFIFCDERLVAYDNADSTFGVFDNLLLKDPEVSKVITKDNFVLVDPNLGSALEAAADYEKKLMDLQPDGIFDLLLLGMGPDGHTCSLFPGHPLLDEKTKVVAAITDSPKPPPERVTLTLPVINRANHVAFVATGSSKAPVLKEIFGEDTKESAKSKYPSACVQPSKGTLIWIIDEAANPN